MQNMTRMLRLGFVALLVCFANLALAQNGALTGNLKDERGNPIISAYVEASLGGIVTGREVTDFDGNYTIKPLNAGRYTVTFKYQGKELVITDISLTNDQIRTVNGTLVITKSATGDKDVVVRTTRKYVAPLIDPKEPGGRSTKTAEQIEATATRNSLDIASLSTQTYQQGRGGGIAIGGARTSGTKVIIDGVQQNPGSAAFINQAPGSVEAITTFSSGVPARYGDASGGLITITTKGPSTFTQGNVQYEHSVDGYNRNELTLNLSGPLIRRKDSSGNLRNVVGYTIAADGIYAQDNDPQYYKIPYVKSDVYNQIYDHPLRLIPGAGGAQPEYAALYLRESDLEYKKRQPNADYYRGQFTGKLDFNLTPSVSVRVGGTYNVADAAGYSRYNSLLSFDNFSRSLTQRAAGYVRLTQKFGSNNPEAAKNSSITNAFYTVQVDYSKDWTTNRDKNKGHNTFDYGYVGKFEEKYAPAYQIGGIDTATGKAGIKLVGYSPTNVVFTPGTQNPGLANYTKDAYSFSPNMVDQTAIQAFRGLRNGDNPTGVYSLWNNVGIAPTGWSKSSADQVAVQVDASFDLKHNKTTHNIQFGLYYQQRNERYYNINGSGIWTLMRQLSNRVVNQEVEAVNARFVTPSGDTFTTAQVKAGVYAPSPNDTILYDRKIDTVAQGAFDRRLRQKIYGDPQAKQYINTDAYDPSFYNLSLFSPDDLFNGGSSVIGYAGYDYLGNALNGQVNFNDFWTAKDAEGYYKRPISAYRPNYIAGYLSDYITFKDFNITLGMRVERYDNNTKVLKDPYSLYGVQTAGQYKGDPSNPITHPANIGSDYVVYVGGNSSQNPSVIGYRNGDTWYTREGVETPDPQLLRTATQSDVLVPKLQSAGQNIKDETYKPDEAFEDYKPQVNVMPRINFSFPLNDNALFYAHYDIMYQRPNTGAYAVQTDYMFLDQNPTRIYNNSNLRPERTVDYEVGFQQRISSNSGITLSGFYRERKDQIQIRPYLYAYPTTYYTYGNRDFSTYKGLSLAYELRRTNHVTLNINYTLSFTEGTGSSATSANGGDGSSVSNNSLLQQLIQSGLPNIRPQFPLNTDSRHNINAQVDYRYLDGEGPMIGNSRLLQNAGINFVFRVRTGEPYTKYAYAQSIQAGANNSPVIVGSVNGSRLNAHYGFDVKLDKTIFLRYKELKDNDGKVLARTPTRFGVNIYAYAQNVFNIRDVLGVYSYTGRADDDGFLSSPIGLQQVPRQVDPVSFSDLYRVGMYNPGAIGAPRSILIGASLNF
jgi:hypothetical protein